MIGFHSTLLMNFITYFGIVSLYYEGTIKKQGWFNGPGRMKRRDERWADKYRARGFDILLDSSQGQDSIGWHKCRLSPRCTQTIRSLLDEGVQVWKFPGYESCKASRLLKKLEPWFIWRLQTKSCAVQDRRQDRVYGFAATPRDYIKF